MRNDDSSEEDEGILRDINDPLIPSAVRNHARRFRKPAAYVLDFGNGEYLLYAEDGELLDMLTYGGP